MLGEEEKEELPPAEEKKLVEREETPMLEISEEQRLEELEDRLLRLQAEFENFRKRTAKEHEMLRQNAGANAIMNLLEVVDEFDIAMGHIKEANEEDFKKGMSMIYNKLKEALRREGLEEMEILGKSFDPHFHDAIGFEEGEEGKILKIVKNGYLYKGKVLRHAKVIVGKEKK